MAERKSELAIVDNEKIRRRQMMKNIYFCPFGKVPACRAVSVLTTRSATDSLETFCVECFSKFCIDCGENFRVKITE